MRSVGTEARGIRAPIIKSGDNLRAIVVESVLKASREHGFSLRDRDVIGVTEAVVARAQNNYATLNDIATDIHVKFPAGHVGVVFPILSRNRFSHLLRGIARGAEKTTVLLSYPSDEVGNPLVSKEMLLDAGLGLDTFMTEADFRERFGAPIHPFTNMDYVAYYRSLGENIEVVFSNDPRDILRYTPDVLCADIHTRETTKRILSKSGARTVLGLDDILSHSVNGSGYNANYGLLGSNMASESRIKLFPHNCNDFVEGVQADLLEATGRHVEVMVYGDGAFKDPQAGIWELADPVVSPAYTQGLMGTPNELKLKYLADTRFASLSGEDLQQAMREFIASKPDDVKDSILAQGTTPRRLCDILGSLCDLVSGSGDKGTPIILVQGYFDDYATE